MKKKVTCIVRNTSITSLNCERRAKFWRTDVSPTAQGGLVIYRADSYDTVKAYVENDPYVVHGARTYHIHEWEMVTGRGPLQN